MKDNGPMTKRAERVHTHGPMELNMMVYGKMTARMGKVL